MTQGKIGAAIMIAITLGFWLPTVSGAQEDFCKIMKLVRIRDGKPEGDILNVNAEELQIRDSVGRDRTPEGGANEGDDIALGRYVYSGQSINAALEISNSKVFWIGSDTLVQVKGDRIRLLKGEIYAEAGGIRFEFADGKTVNSTGGGLYLRAADRAEEEPSVAYLLEGSWVSRIIDKAPRLGSDTLVQIENGELGTTHTLDKRMPIALIGTEQTKLYSLDELSEDIEQDRSRAKALKKITGGTKWKQRLKVKMPYILTTAVLTAGISTAMYYLLRGDDLAEVRIVVRRPVP